MSENRNSRIKKALSEAGVTQKNLGDRLGVSDATVNERLKKKKQIDSISFLQAVSALTGKSFEWLLDGDFNEELPSVVTEAEPVYNTDMLKVMKDQARHQVEYIEHLKEKIRSLEVALAKNKKAKR